jgi:predicted MFS family arabinose efflux permease
VRAQKLGLARLALPSSVRVAVHTLGVTQIVSWGTTFYAPAVFSAPIIAETGWSKTEVYGAFSASLVLGALIARRVGRLIDERGGRNAMSLGSVLCALGLLVLAAAESYAVYLGAWLLLGIAMRFALYEAAFATLTAAARHEARRAISVLTLYGGFASTVFWPIGFFLVEALGWRMALVVFAVLNLAICLPMHLFLLPRGGPAPAGDAGPRAAPIDTSRILTGRERTLALWLLSAAFALFSFMSSAFSAHLIDTLVALGLSAPAAVTTASLRGVGQVGARLWELLFAARLGPLALSMLALGLTSVAFLPLAAGVSIVTGTLFTLVQGAGNGLVTIARGVAPLLLFGPQGYGALTGAMAAPSLVAAAFAPAAHAALVDLAGNRAGLLFEAGVATLAVLLVAALALRLRRL